MGLIEGFEGRIKQWFIGVALQKAAKRSVSALFALLVAKGASLSGLGVMVHQTDNGLLELILDPSVLEGSLALGAFYLFEVARNWAKHKLGLKAA